MLGVCYCLQCKQVLPTERWWDAEGYISVQNVQPDWSWKQIWEFSIRCTISACGRWVYPSSKVSWYTTLEKRSAKIGVLWMNTHILLFKSKMEENKETHLFGMQHWCADPGFELMFWLLPCASYKLNFLRSLAI